MSGGERAPPLLDASPARRAKSLLWLLRKLAVAMPLGSDFAPAVAAPSKRGGSAAPALALVVCSGLYGER